MTSTPQLSITGATRLIGFVGDPVRYAKSPQGFNARLAAIGRDAILVPLHVKSEAFDQSIKPLMLLGNVDGLVVTMPFKERIIQLLDDVSPRARAVGAVNAAKRMADGRWVGDIFDGEGLVGAARGLGLDLRGLAVGLVGAGGAGSAIALALAEAGVARLVIQDRNAQKAERLAQTLSGCASVFVTAGSVDVGAIDLLVHATPVGMNTEDGIAVDTEHLRARTAVIDIVTRPDTPLLEQARQRGCRHVGGTAMVTAQTEAILRFLDLLDPTSINSVLP